MTIRTREWQTENPTRTLPRMNREAWRKYLFRHREALLLPLAVPVIVAALRGGGIDYISALLGAGTAAAGVLLRLGAVRQIGRGARVFHAHARAGLITTGPYRWTRNPLYLAAALMLCGLGLIAGAGWMALALLFATLIAYTPVVLIEERALTKLLGVAYQQYIADVPRWIGFRRLDRGAPSDALVAWREVLHREKKLIPWTLTALLAIAAVRGEWIPVASLARRVELACGLDRAVLVAGAMAIALLVNAIKVELHQRGRERRVARVDPADRSVSARDARQPQLEARAAKR